MNWTFLNVKIFHIVSLNLFVLVHSLQTLPCSHVSIITVLNLHRWLSRLPFRCCCSLCIFFWATTPFPLPETCLLWGDGELAVVGSLRCFFAVWYFWYFVYLILCLFSTLSIWYTLVVGSLRCLGLGGGVRLGTASQSPCHHSWRKVEQVKYIALERKRRGNHWSSVLFVSPLCLKFPMQ